LLEGTEEQESRVIAGSRPRCGAYGLLTVVQRLVNLQVREILAQESTWGHQGYQRPPGFLCTGRS